MFCNYNDLEKYISEQYVENVKKRIFINMKGGTDRRLIGAVYNKKLIFISTDQTGCYIWLVIALTMVHDDYNKN